MFGIIAGVLVGVWAIYTMLAEEMNVKMAVAEIQLVREAAVQFKNNNGNGKYNGMTLATFGPYLGDGIGLLRDNSPYGITIGNTFGSSIDLTSDRYRGGGRDGGDIYMTYRDIPNMNICRQVLERFGEVTELTQYGETGYYIPVGKTIFGYVGGANYYAAGCLKDNYSGLVSLQLYID